MSHAKDKKPGRKPLEGCHALILAGGSGTRLWPLSRNLFPKQLLALDGGKTLLQQTVERALFLFDPDAVWIVTNEEHVYEVRSQVRDLDEGLEARVLAEPLARNTLPAILLGLDGILERDPKARVAVFPSDHLIQDLDALGAVMKRGAALAAKGKFVTFGIKPGKAETGYGYIARGEKIGQGSYEVEGFVEKPDLATAKRFVKDGAHYWNSGMFMFPAKAFLAAVEEFEPALWAWWEARLEIPLLRGYGALPSVSVDYGIAERVSDLAVVEANFDWDDLGNWEALYRLGAKDENGNVTQGDVLAMDCSNSLLISRGGKLAAVGLDSVIMVQTRDATLACPLANVQQVKDVVNVLKGEGSSLVESHVTVHRPWGSYTVLEEGPHYKIKRIVVKPGARLSKQMHHHRSEHWVGITGTALVEVDEKEIILTENQSVDIPKASTHRLANPGKVDLEIIEIQSGPYLEEDDIVRFDDIYGRMGDGAAPAGGGESGTGE